jgi:hypothetical protein
MRRNVLLAQTAMQVHETALREDKYGGATPQETKNLFVDALKRRNLNLASQYFVREFDGTLNREWSKFVLEAENQEKIPEIIALFDSEYVVKSFGQNQLIFIFNNRDDSKRTEMDFIKNDEAGIWKINSIQ